MNTSKITSRLIPIGVSVVFIVTIFFIVTFSNAKKKVVSIYDDRLIPILQLTKIADYYDNNISFCLREIKRNEIAKDEACQIIETVIKESNHYWSDYLKSYLTPTEKGITLKTAKTKHLLDNQLLQIEKLLISKNTRQTDIVLQKLIESIIHTITTDYNKQLESLIKIQKTEATILEIQFQQLYQEVILFTSVICLLCLSVVILFYKNSKLQKILVSKNKKLESKSNELHEAKKEIDATLEELRCSNEELYSSNEELQVSKEELANVNTKLIENNTELEKYKNQLELLVTERTIELHKSEERYGLLFEYANDAIFILKEGRFIECNSKTLEIYGCTKEQIINKMPFDFSPVHQSENELSWEKANSLIQLAIQGIPQKFEWKHIRFDESEFYAEVSLKKIDVNNEVLLFAIVRDVTERKQAEVKLQESEVKFRAIFESSRDAISVSKSGTFVLGNSSYLSMFGFENNDAILNKPIIDCIAPNYRGKMKEQIRRRAAGENVESFYETRCIKTDGTEFDVEINVSPYILLDELYTVASIRNITERKKAEFELAESYSKLSAILESTNDFIWTVDPHDFKILTFNSAIKKYFQTKLGVTITVGFNMNEYYQQHFLAPNAENIWNVYYNKVITEGAFDVIHETVGGLYLHLSFNPIMNNNELIGISVFGKDITNIQLTENALLKSEQRLQTLLHSVTDYMYSVKIEKGKAVETYHGEGCFPITGYTPEDFINDSNLWFKIVFNMDKSSVHSHIDRILNKSESEVIEHRIVHKNGSIHWIRNTPVLRLNTDNEVIGYDGLISDITAEKNLQHQIITSVIETEEKERLHFSQELHDGIGPLLSATKMYIQLLKSHKSDDNSNTILGKVEKLLDESSSTIREISFKLSPHILQNYGLIEALKAYAEKIRETTKIEFDFQYSTICTLNEKFEIIIYRILCECTNNTLKYAKATKISIDMYYENNQLTVLYSDNGKGFDTAIIQNNKGIGILNMKSRINSINGQMHVTSSENNGTVIKFQIDTSILESNV